MVMMFGWFSAEAALASWFMNLSQRKMSDGQAPRTNFDRL
jgi:hypothetical protein